MTQSLTYFSWMWLLKISSPFISLKNVFWTQRQELNFISFILPLVKFMPLLQLVNITNLPFYVISWLNFSLDWLTISSTSSPRLKIINVKQKNWRLLVSASTCNEMLEVIASLLMIKNYNKLKINNFSWTHQKTEVSQ